MVIAIAAVGLLGEAMPHIDARPQFSTLAFGAELHSYALCVAGEVAVEMDHMIANWLARNVAPQFKRGHQRTPGHFAPIVDVGSLAHDQELFVNDLNEIAVRAKSLEVLVT